jgi:hypothetical protein
MTPMVPPMTLNTARLRCGWRDPNGAGLLWFRPGVQRLEAELVTDVTIVTAFSQHHHNRYNRP